MLFINLLLLSSLHGVSLGVIFPSTVPSTVQKLRILLPFSHSFNKDFEPLGSVLGAGNTSIYTAKIILLVS